MNKKTIISIVAILIVVIASGVWWQSSHQKYTGSVEKVTVGVVPQFSLLVLLAQKQGFFRENGLDVSIQNYEAGPPILKDMSLGKLDAGVVGEFVFVGNSFNKEDIKILASISTSNSVKMVARVDHSILKPSDLKGKKVGVTKKTSAEFFMQRFLEFNSISQKEITVVDLPPPGVTKAILDGTVDAAVPFSNDVSKIEQSLGKNVVTWDAQNGQDAYTLLLTNDSFIQKHKDTTERFIRALKQSDEYVKGHSKEVLEFLAETAHISYQESEKFYSQFRFELSLQQSLVLILEDEARFAIANKLTDKTVVPNYIDFIYTDALRKVKLDAVTLY